MTNWITVEIRKHRELMQEIDRLRLRVAMLEPYSKMADQIVEACIEASNYDELYNRCMDAIDAAEPGMRYELRKVKRG